jgi:hypothetical protein
MKSYDIREDISRRVGEAIEAEKGLGVEAFGYSVSMLLAQVNGKDAIIWAVLITCRSPLLGQPDIGTTSKLQGNAVQDALIVAEVRKSIALLRAEFQRKLAAGVTPSNGHVPGAVKGRLN